MDSLYVGLAAALGLMVGSFLNVVIWRVPRDESVVSPPSACPNCGNYLRPWHNIPVLSWVLLRAKCAFCGTRISASYPLVEALTAMVFGLATWITGIGWHLLPLSVFLAVGIALAFIDIDLKILPDKIVLPSYPVMMLLLVFASWNPGGASNWGALSRAGVGMVALLLLYGGAWWFYPRGMGFGDVKFAGVVGLTLGWFGWGVLVIGAFAAFLFGGIGGVILLSATRRDRKYTIPFGPWMVIGSWFGLLAGERLWTLYLDTFF